MGGGWGRRTWGGKERRGINDRATTEGDDEIEKRQRRSEKKRGKRNVRKAAGLADNALCDFALDSSERGERLSDGRRKRWSAASSKGQLRLPFFLTTWAFDPQNPK